MLFQASSSLLLSPFSPLMFMCLNEKYLQPFCYYNCILSEGKRAQLPLEKEENWKKIWKVSLHPTYMANANDGFIFILT